MQPKTGPGKKNENRMGHVLDLGRRSRVRKSVPVHVCEIRTSTGLFPCNRKKSVIFVIHVYAYMRLQCLLLCSRQTT